MKFNFSYTEGQQFRHEAQLHRKAEVCQVQGFGKPCEGTAQGSLQHKSMAIRIQKQ